MVTLTLNSFCLCSSGWMIRQALEKLNPEHDKATDMIEVRASTLQQVNSDITNLYMSLLNKLKRGKSISAKPGETSLSSPFMICKVKPTGLKSLRPEDASVFGPSNKQYTKQ